MQRIVSLVVLSLGSLSALSISSLSAEGIVYSTGPHTVGPSSITMHSPVPAMSTVVQSSGAVCPKCGKVHGSSSQSANQQVTYTAPTSANPTFNSGNGSRGAGALQGGGSIQNVLSTLNAQRARQGIGSLRYDPSLQAVAERRAQMMASMSLKSHPPGSYAPGTYEGVGWSSSYSPSGVSACFTSDPRMQVAGAAMATGRDGVYFAVVYR
ncbi:hypothetical protein Pla22_19210 [Rubripirellula amarantea]|uniref:SCP domain-containing protein n=1 Tax=Rubripirellula amarantea TaxID=2527999 RepID=A0A5C5WVJ5_9BACT|nr:CAP domain-containing protein [Rubripirellula amarantea]TWT54279.1 hypothetical protein Pla22_19210 [Rubripirellula amarantea]